MLDKLKWHSCKFGASQEVFEQIGQNTQLEAGDDDWYKAVPNLLFPDIIAQARHTDQRLGKTEQKNYKHDQGVDHFL